ncbi:MAG: isopentenyl-diphosphate Delta-isomerase [Gammaproteobacteria bacterium]|nr:isopentenyl-diphosphate Delta-isomerase [Gammaproteobacteria bacterium]
MNNASAAANQIVSNESEELILVDENDNEVGFASKSDCHDGEGILHRAFSVFVFNDDDELLLQQRAAGKRLWPLFWSNTCCSHPRRGETLDEATGRRLMQELGFRCDLEYLYKFHYQAKYEDLGSEHELCSVFRGKCDARVTANVHEIADYRWVGRATIDAELAHSPDRFTPWFHLEWAQLRDKI